MTRRMFFFDTTSLSLQPSSYPSYLNIATRYAIACSSGGKSCQAGPKFPGAPSFGRLLRLHQVHNTALLIWLQLSQSLVLPFWQ